jgi:hypothetical protein
MIIPLEEKHLIDIKNQNHLEMLYLLIVRCQQNVGRALIKVRENYKE